LLFDQQLELWQALSFLSRDFALCLFAGKLLLHREWTAHRCRAIRWGKITTAMQFALLITLFAKWPVPPAIYSFFIVSGILAYVELNEKRNNAMN
jgi:phosphatidylglycerophosphate synthase